MLHAYVASLVWQIPVGMKCLKINDKIRNDCIYAKIKTKIIVKK